MKSLGIIWNSAYDFKDQIINDLKNFVKVKDNFSMDLGENYEKFVRTLYSFDEIADWKVDKKIETMFKNSDERKIEVVLFDVNTDNVRYHPYKKRDVYSDLEDLKIFIRNKYSELVPEYFFDNVFHATDDEKEFEQDFKFVNNFKSIFVIEDESSTEKAAVKTIGVHNEFKK